MTVKHLNFPAEVLWPETHPCESDLLCLCLLRLSNVSVVKAALTQCSLLRPEP